MITPNSKTEQPRVQSSLLSGLEARCLKWIAAHLPDRLMPDHLTLLGLLSMIGAGVFYILSVQDRHFLHGVNLCLFLNWFGDSLDGTLARHRQTLRPRYGFYIDHFIDSLGAVLLFGGIALSGLMGERVAAGLLIAYLLLSIHSYLSAYTVGTFRISFWGFSPTELRLLLVVGNLVAVTRPQVTLAGYRLGLFDVGGVVGLVAILVVLFPSVIGTARRLYQLERAYE